MTQLIADVFDCVLRDSDTKEVIGLTTLQDAQIQAKVNSSDVIGGKGGQVIAVLNSNRDISIQLTDVEINYKTLARQFGQDVVTGAGVAYAMPKSYSVSGSTVILDNPVSTKDADNALSIVNSDGESITGFTVTGNTVSLSTATPTVSSGDSVTVETYKYDTDATTESIQIDNAVFARGMECILETYELDDQEKITHKVQFQFTNALMDGNFTLDTKSQKQAVTDQTTLRILKPSNSTVVGKLLRIPYTG